MTSTSEAPATERIVFLHGVGLDRHVWDRVIALLDRTRYDVSAPDLLGHGTSSPAPDGTTLADLADPVVDTLNADEPAHLVGFSLGALVAQHIAIHRPDLVRTLTCVNSVCDRTPAERDAVLARLQTAREDFAGGIQASLRRWYDGTEVPDEEIRLTEKTLSGNDIDSYLNCYRVFATADAEVAPALAGITAPTLAITGSDDPGSTPEMSRRLAAAIPDCDVRILDDTRHMLPVQRPGEFTDALTALLKEH